MSSKHFTLNEDRHKRRRYKKKTILTECTECNSSTKSIP